MLRCTVCSNVLAIRKLACPACEIEAQGDFGFPRLLRLSGRNLALSEALILSGGNLKALARTLGISYPTLRKRVDALIEELAGLRAEDERRIGEILRGIEAGTIAPAKGTRMISELNGGA